MKVYRYSADGRFSSAFISEFISEIVIGIMLAMAAAGWWAIVGTICILYILAKVFSDCRYFPTFSKLQISETDVELKAFSRVLQKQPVQGMAIYQLKIFRTKFYAFTRADIKSPSRDQILQLAAMRQAILFPASPQMKEDFGVLFADVKEV